MELADPLSHLYETFKSSHVFGLITHCLFVYLHFFNRKEAVHYAGEQSHTQQDGASTGEAARETCTASSPAHDARPVPGPPKLP